MTATPPTQPAAQERRVATALFADLSGFTALAADLAPEELARVIDPVLAGLTDLVAAYGGQVEKFAGDAVLAVFGAPVAHDDDAERALRCAAEMHAVLPTLSRHTRAAELTLHIGVNTGPVLAREAGSDAHRQYAVLGDAVVLAQRLESLAEPGETLVGAATAGLAGSAVSLEDVGLRTVKGRAEPVQVFRLVSVAESPGRRGRTAGRLVGRDQETATLQALLDDLASGRGAAVALCGEAGVGKTRLVEHLRTMAGDITVLTGGAASYGGAVPYLPVLPWLRSLPGAADDEGVARLLRGRGVEDEPDRSPEALRAGVRRAVAAGLTDLAAGRGAVVVCEDLHWADEATRDLLSWLAGQVARSGVLLVVTGREAAQCREVLTGPTSDPVLLELAPLDRQQVADLASDLLGAPPDDRFADLVLLRSRGNPFFAAELLESLRADQVVRLAGGRWRLPPGHHDDDVPLTVQAVLAGRLDALPGDLAEVVGAVAVVADRGSPRFIGAVLETSTELAAARLLLVVEHGLMEPLGDEFGFRHDLVREVAADRVAEGRRRELHVLAAEAVARLGGQAEAVTAVVAQHLFLAGARRLALPHLRAAAAAARAVFANAEAAVALDRAAQAAGLDPPDPGLAEDLLALAEVRELQGDHVGAAETFAAAAGAGAGAAAVAGQAGALRRAGRYDDALAVLDGTPPPGDRRLLDLERSWVLGVMGRRADAMVAARLGLDSGGRDRVAGLLELQLVRLLTLDGDLDEARRRAEAALALVVGDATAVVTAYRLLGDVEHRAGDLDRARAVLQDGLAEAHRTGNLDETAACLVNLGLVASAAGDHAAAAEHYDQAVDAFAAAANPVGQAVAMGNRAWELMHLDRLDEAEQDGEQSVQLAGATGNGLVLADSTNTLALVAQRRGDTALAADRAKAAAAAFRAAGAEREAADADALLADLTAAPTSTT